mgnify:CR=1 FL=1
MPSRPAPPRHHSPFGRPGLLLALVVLTACAPKEAPAPAPMSADELAKTWLWQLAFDSPLSSSEAPLASRWLGGAGEDWPATSWSQPGVRPSSSLAARAAREDAQALALLADIYDHALCRFAQTDASFGQELPEGYLFGLESCRAVEDERGAERALRLAERLGATPGGGTNPSGPLEASLADLLPDSPKVVTERVLNLDGELLRYRFLRPGVLHRFTRDSGGGDRANVDEVDFGRRLATSAWTEGSLPELPRAEVILEGSGSPPHLGAVEQAAEETLDVLGRSLRDHGARVVPPLEGGDIKALLAWARRALYRDLGLALLADDQSELALPLLEEAAGSSARLRPGPGLDPVLLLGVVKARYEQNQGLRAADLLRTISEQSGWAAADVVADLIARIEVLPDAAGAEIRR